MQYRHVDTSGPQDGGEEVGERLVETCRDHGNGSLSQETNVEAVKTLRNVFPPPSQFESSFKNPCWYMHFNLPSHIRKMLWKTNISDSQASYVLSQIFHTKVPSPKKLVCIPKVFMIGFPRSGSTHLYDLLMRHSEVTPGLYKEPHWWTRLPFRAHYSHNMLSIIHYIMHYYAAAKYIQNHPTVLTVDASQSTIWDTRKLCDAPSLMHSVIPQAKYIVLMRDPVSRLFSDYSYLCQHVWVNGEVIHSNNPNFVSNGSNLFHQAVLEELQIFEQCMRRKSFERCTHNALLGSRVMSHDGIACGRVRLGISLYHVHVSRWLKIIPRDQFLFLRTEDLAADPYVVLQKVWQFLELPAQSQDDLSNILYEHSNSNQLTSVEIDPETRKILEQFFQPHNEKLAHLLSDEKFLWKKPQ